MKTKPFLRIDRLQHPYVCQGQPLSLCVEAPTVLALTGPSGIGKSTLLRVLLGTEEKALAFAGSYEWFGREVEESRWKGYRQGLAFVPASSRLLPFLSPSQQISWVRKLSHRKSLASEDWQRIVRELELDDVLRRASTRGLSSGQMARLCLAQALVTQPRALLIDESLGRVSRDASDRALALLENLAKKWSALVILVTHDPDLAAKCRDRVHLDLPGGLQRI